jgi:hypothetical protein
MQMRSGILLVRISSYRLEEISQLRVRFAVVGAVVLLYDHAITFKEEVRCIWKAPSSFAKYAFLVNRYLVPSLLVVIIHGMCSAWGETETPIHKFDSEMCGFNGSVYGDKEYDNEARI